MSLPQNLFNIAHDGTPYLLGHFVDDYTVGTWVEHLGTRFLIDSVEDAKGRERENFRYVFRLVPENQAAAYYGLGDKPFPPGLAKSSGAKPFLDLGKFLGRKSSCHFNVRPRYTPGSPAMVGMDLAERVAREEARAIRAALEGAYGVEQQKKAQEEGLKGIAEAVYEKGKNWIVLDLITGEQYERPIGGRA